MKELASVGGNHLAKYDEKGNLVPYIEVVINTTEPVYRLSPDGEIIKRRDAFTVRFVTDPESLRKFADELNEQARISESAFAAAMSDPESLRKFADELNEQARISESAFAAAMSDQKITPKFFTQEGSGMFWRWDGRSILCLELGEWIPSHFSSPDDLSRVLGNIKEIDQSKLPAGTKP